MKKQLISMIVLLFAICSCDKIEDTDRSHKVDEINAIRPVLLEDFTGQNCTNCPRAAKRAANMQLALKENMVVVGIHAGTFATSKFKTEVGTKYQETFYESNEGYPAGMVDRCSFDNSLVSTNDSKWGTYIINRVSRSDIPLLNLSLTCEYNEIEKSFVVKAIANGITFIPKVMIQLWITESHIIDYQRSEGETIREYEHNHVLRDAVNGTWGEEIDIKVGFDTEYKSTPYSLADKKWKPENMHVVGFVYDAETMEVLHATEIPMLNNLNK